MPPNRTRRTVAIVAGLLAAQLILVAAFVVPGRKPEPHRLPVGVTGPATAVVPVERALAARGDAFEIHRFGSVAQARAAIEERDVNGAVAPTEGRLLIATAASPVVAQLLQQSLGRGLQVEDVAPLPDEDPRGTVPNLMFLPLIVICLPLAALLGLLGLRGGELLAATAAFAALSGLLVVALAGEAMGALAGSFLALWAVASLVVAAITLPATGLMRALGPAGLGIAAVLFIVIGNPGSGNASAPELLPGFWRVVGPLLPPGAGGQGLRNTAYFDGNALAQPLIVLAAWAALGAALILLAPSRTPPAPAVEQERALAA